MATDDTCCTIVPYFEVQSGQMDEFKALCERFVAKTGEESDCLYRAYPVVTHTHYMYGVATSGSGGGRSGDGCFAAARPFVWGLHT